MRLPVFRPYVSSALYWSNALGWTTKSESDTFDDDEKSKSALPMDGPWVQVTPHKIY